MEWFEDKKFAKSYINLVQQVLLPKAKQLKDEFAIIYYETKIKEYESHMERDTLK